MGFFFGFSFLPADSLCYCICFRRLLHAFNQALSQARGKGAKQHTLHAEIRKQIDCKKFFLKGLFCYFCTPLVLFIRGSNSPDSYRDGRSSPQYCGDQGRGGQFSNFDFIPGTLQQAEVAHLVEHDLAKVGVAGSSPVFRSESPLVISRGDFFWNNCPGGGIGRHAGLKIL